jgi:hypothetical protein
MLMSFADPTPVERSEPVNIKSSGAHGVDPVYKHSQYDPGSEMGTMLEKWCAGQPPKKSYLNPDGSFSSRFPLTRRSTIADMPELDHLIDASRVYYKGEKYLPITAATVHRLSPYYRGAKPMADMKVFERVMITREINGVPADHVTAALERIGEHTEHLLVVAPVHTSELDNVFARQYDDVSPGSDWDHLLTCMPNLKYVTFVHPDDESVELSCKTFFALQLAVANRQSSQQLVCFSFDVPMALITNFVDDVAKANATAALTDTDNAT